MQMKWSFKILTLVFALSLNGVIALGLPPDNYLKGIALYEQGKSDEALQSFQSGLKDQNAENKTYLYIGIIYLEKNDINKAIENLEKANRNYISETSYYLAKAWARAGNLDKCLEYLDIHLRSTEKRSESEIFLDPDFEKFEHNKVWLNFWNEGNYYSKFDKLLATIDYQIENQEYTEALSSLNEGLKRGYRKSVLLEKRADVYLLMNNEKLALEDMNKSVSGDKRNPRLLEKRGDILLNLGKNQSALEDYEQALRYDPDLFGLYLKRAAASQKEGNFDEAQKDMDFYLNYFPGNKESLYTIARIYMDEGLYLNSLKYLNQIIEKDASQAEYFAARGDSYYHTKTYKNANRDFSMSLDLDPENPEVWYSKGLTSIKLGDKDHACYCFRQAFRLGKKEAYNELSNHCPDFFR